MRYLSVCSGIEAATVAWHPLGWTPAAFSEIERFPRAVLQHHYPDVPLHGDFTTIKGDEYGSVDVLVGGTPCQSFSVAGLRKGMDDARGNLALQYLRLAARLNARWLVWENVPGVLSSNGGRDFGAFLGGLAELGYGWAYRVLDAQFFGVPQRRRRVFVVGYLGDWRRAAAVLFERASLSGHPAPSREAGEVAPTIPSRSSAGGGLGTDFDCDGGLIHAPVVSPALKARDYKGPSSDGDGDGAPLIAHTLRAEGFDASEDGTGRGTPLVPVLAFDTTQVTSRVNRSNPKPGDPCHPLAAGAHPPAVAFANTAGATALGMSKPGVPPLTGRNGDPGNVHVPGMAVRRITPTEAERLQGFSDGYTLVPYRGKPAEDCPDGPRYKALGNSMAVPVMRWIGERIAMVEAL
jgi:DNA (cytosine-5)-methyltransferase 1